MKIVTSAEMREIDRATSEKFGVPTTTLMENAGTAVADFCVSQYPRAQHVTVICGRGNNGGDGFVAARKLHEAGKKIGVLLLGEPADLKGDAKTMFDKLPVPVFYAKTPKELESKTVRSLYFDADVLIDAILGTGFTPPLTALTEQAVQLFNESRSPVISVDLPTGVQADSIDFNQPQVCRSNAIVTFTAPKPAHVLSLLTHGPIVVASIGSPPQAIESRSGLEWTGSKVAIFRKRSVTANKGEFGHVLVVAGSLGKAGAAAMSSVGALRVGAGLVTAAVPRSVLATVAGFAPELMTEPLAESDAATVAAHALEGAAFDTIIERKSIVALGPGLSQNQKTQQFIRNFVGRCELPMVLDADGLNAFQEQTELLDGSKRLLVLTPHPGEMSRLTGLSVERILSNRIALARNFSIQHKVILVLKGWRTLVAAPDGKVHINTTGNPGMAKGGAGDVLTGMIAGILAQFPSRPVEAVCAAVYLHGLAGDLAVADTEEHSLLATDLLAHISNAFRETLHRNNGIVWLQGRPRQQ